MRGRGDGTSSKATWSRIVQRDCALAPPGSQLTNSFYDQVILPRHQRFLWHRAGPRRQAVPAVASEHSRRVYRRVRQPRSYWPWPMPADTNDSQFFIVQKALSRAGNKPNNYTILARLVSGFDILQDILGTSSTVLDPQASPARPSVTIVTATVISDNHDGVLRPRAESRGRRSPRSP